MIPELGKYAFAVLSSWGISLVLLAAMVAVSYLQSKRVKRQLAEVEARQEKKNG